MKLSSNLPRTPVQFCMFSSKHGSLTIASCLRR